jgi:hypothetical protein
MNIFSGSPANIGVAFEKIKAATNTRQPFVIKLRFVIFVLSED